MKRRKNVAPRPDQRVAVECKLDPLQDTAKAADLYARMLRAVRAAKKRRAEEQSNAA